MEFIPHEIDGDVMILRAEGGLDASNASEFMDQVKAMTEGGFSRLIIDCVDLTHISSIGLGVLFRTHARAAKLGGQVKLCNVSGMPMQVLTVMRLNRVFGIYQDVDQARLSFRSED